MNRHEKIKYLKGLKTGERSLQQITPVTFMTFFKINGVITDNNGNVFTMEEINNRYSMSLNNTWVEVQKFISSG